MIDISRKIIEICGISAENIKVYIVSKIDNIYVLWIKSSENKLYRVNFPWEKILIIPEAYSYFKELFKEK